MPVTLATYPSPPGSFNGSYECAASDEWASRKRHTYGTILVDLERHRGVDLLPDCSSEAVAAWLQAYPGIEVIARDRSGPFAAAATLGAPDAGQVADRWHLLVNVRDALERLLAQQPACLQAAAAVPVPPVEPVLETVPEPRRLGISRNERAMETTRILDPYLPYLQQHSAAGCHNGAQLYRDIRDWGYNGSRSLIGRWVADKRRGLRKQRREGSATTLLPTRQHVSV